MGGKRPGHRVSKGCICEAGGPIITGMEVGIRRGGNRAGSRVSRGCVWEAGPPTISGIPFPFSTTSKITEKSTQLLTASMDGRDSRSRRNITSFENLCHKIAFPRALVFLMKVRMI